MPRSAQLTTTTYIPSDSESGSVFERRSDLLWTVAIAGAVAAASGPTGTLASPLGPLDAVAGLAAPLGLLFGVPAVVGVCSGVVVGGVAQMGPSWWLVLDCLAYGGGALVGARLWSVLAGRESLRSAGGWFRCGGACLVGVTTSASVLAWGAVVGWQTPFYAVALPAFAVGVRSLALVGGPVLAAAGLVAWSRETGGQAGLLSVEGGLAIATPGVWFAVATVASLAVDGHRGQILVGGVAIAVLAVTYTPLAPWHRSPTTGVSVES